MRKTKEIINGWKEENKKPHKIIFNITIDKPDFDLMVSEIEQLEADKDYWKQKCLLLQKQ